MILEKKCFKDVIFRQELRPNNTSKQKVGHCDKTTLQIFFIFIILNTYIPLIFHAKIQPKYSKELEKKLILSFLLFLVTPSILDIRSDPVLQFWDAGVRSCSM